MLGGILGGVAGTLGGAMATTGNTFSTATTAGGGDTTLTSTPDGVNYLYNDFVGATRTRTGVEAMLEKKYIFTGINRDPRIIREDDWYIRYINEFSHIKLEF
jgi:hypothetical protein